MNANKLLKMLLGTGIYLLEQSDKATKKQRAAAADSLDDFRSAAGDRYKDFRSAAKDKYSDYSDRVSRAAAALRDEDSSTARNLIMFAAGIGLGVGIGMIMAPASGEETREVIAGRVQEIGDRVRERFASEDVGDGTNG